MKIIIDKKDIIFLYNIININKIKKKFHKFK